MLAQKLFAFASWQILAAPCRVLMFEFFKTQELLCSYNLELQEVPVLINPEGLLIIYLGPFFPLLRTQLSWAGQSFSSPIFIRTNYYIIYSCD